MPKIISKLIFIALILVVSFGLSACSARKASVPVGTIPKSKPVSTAEEQYGHTVLQKMSEKWPLDYDDPRLDTVNEIVEKLTVAANADQEPWHVYLFKAPKVKNAAATRGNHVFVWSGMLDWVQTDDELATILGHELAHVLARHTDPDPNEEAKKLLIRIGAMAAGIAVTRGMDGGQAAANLGRVAAGVTDQLARGVLVNPYSRQLEHEADHVGLMIMAQAGYDPNQALVFWERASTDPSFGGGSSAFFSTHPPAVDRLGALKRAMPIAEQRRSGSWKGPIASPVAPGQSKSQGQNSGPAKHNHQIAQNNSSNKGDKWEDKYYGQKARNRTPGSSRTSSNRIIPGVAAGGAVGAPAGSSKGASQALKQTPAAGNPSIGAPTASDRIPTFDVGGGAKQTKIQTSKWRVISDKAVLFEFSDQTSRKIGEIRKGGTITATKDLGAWLKVAKPDLGYIEKNSVAPAY